jgi:hypothetical protein
MKVWQIALGIGVVALTLGVAGVAYAQVDDPPPAPYGGGYGNGPGSGSCDADGPMHEGMVEALSAELGLPLADLEARIADGECLHDIALAEGLELDGLRGLMLQVREETGVGSMNRMQAHREFRNTEGAGPDGECPMGNEPGSRGFGGGGRFGSQPATQP